MEESDVSKGEKVGFHKGALATLLKEREEMIKRIQVVEQLMKSHLKDLKKLGVDLEAETLRDAKTC